MIEIDQSPIGRTPQVEPGDLHWLFTFIRELFAMVPEARARGFKPGRFSFNVKGGRCEACQGDGVIAIEMHFLPNVYVTCEQCKGRRYNRETLDVKYRGKSIAEVLDLTVDQALPCSRTSRRSPPNCARCRASGSATSRSDSRRRPSRWRGATDEVVARAFQARHRSHALHPR